MIASTVTHPNGVKFSYVVPRTVVFDIRGRFMGSVIDTKANRGVLIEYPDTYPDRNLRGLKVFKSNIWYEDIY